MNPPAGKCALVTGGAQGIGLATAARLAADGWQVAIADRDAEALQEARAAHRGLQALPCDVSDEGAVMRCVADVVAAFGRLEALVNNAGITGATSGPLEALTLAEWNRRIGTNLTGVFLMAKHCAPQLRAAGGAIVNVASTRALQSEPNTEAYSASKGGVIALTHALAMSLGPAVRVNCVSPGWIDVRAWRKRARRDSTPLSAADHAQHTVGRVGKPEDVAALIAWLLSDEAGFVTGQNFVIDGGMTRRMIYVE
ncbi:MAG TPA: SDR family oxidoreductase [Burkholderiales bacterium]|nr:SDR family oxidoreductase [Burkholderiales bacterium]